MRNLNLPIPEEQLDAIDRLRGEVPRTVWIRRAIDQRLIAYVYGRRPEVLHRNPPCDASWQEASDAFPTGLRPATAEQLNKLPPCRICQGRVERGVTR